MKLTFFRLLSIFTILFSFSSCEKGTETKFPEDLRLSIQLKSPGNPAETFQLTPEKSGRGYVMNADRKLPLQITCGIEEIEQSRKIIKIKVKALEEVNFSIEGKLAIAGTDYDDSYFLLPGFWYRQNLRSPENTPSIRISRNWKVREDRLSIPMCAVYDNTTGKSTSILHLDKITNDALMPYKKGEVILHGKTGLGTLGFGEGEEGVFLAFGFPYAEEPFTYIRKLTLDPPVRSFQKLIKNEEQALSWEIRSETSKSYSEFIENTWNYSFDRLNPIAVAGKRSDEEIKTILTQFFTQSYTDNYAIKGFSGVHLRIDECEKRGIMETGFVGRVLLNAYNALEYGYDNSDEDMLRMAHEIFQSYELNGFTRNGLIREVIDFPENHETNIYSIRRQSEGLYAILQFLVLEEKQNRLHPEMKEQARKLLDNLVSLQSGNAFPRKFTDEMEVVDNSGGSTSTAVVPLLMGWKYFGRQEYLDAAEKAAVYLEEEIVSKGDYFSSTLDANCEDKEASIYTSSALYYLGLMSNDEARQTQYYDLAEQAAYFAMSWYYLWDVPFAPGQMLGDLSFRTTGWGNVSVENNHVDVYIFDFADVLKNLSKNGGNSRFEAMAEVIKASMKEQLLPVEGRMCGIAKTGYYPEVVQHTNWDYGQFGKGYYNDIFAPGWVVASLWELLSENRLYNYFISNE